MAKTRHIEPPPITKELVQEMRAINNEFNKRVFVNRASDDEDSDDVPEEQITIDFTVPPNNDNEPVSTEITNISQNAAQDVKVNGEGEGAIALVQQESINEEDLDTSKSKKKKKSRVRFRRQKKEGSDSNSNSGPGDLTQRSRSTSKKYTTITITQREKEEIVDSLGGFTVTTYSPTGSFMLHNSKLDTYIDSVSGPISKEGTPPPPVDQATIEGINKYFKNAWDAKIKQVKDSKGKMTLLHLGKAKDTEKDLTEKKKKRKGKKNRK